MAKAYPKNCDEIISFLNFIKKNLLNFSSEITLPTSTLKKMIENTINFIEKVLVNSEYFNSQTLNINLKKVV